MREALESAGAEVEVIAPLNDRHAQVWRMISAALFRSTGRRLFWERIPSVIDGFARQVDRRLANSKAEWIISPSSLLMPRIRDARPKAFWTDATFGGMIDFYTPKKEVIPFSLRQGTAGEQAALAISKVAAYSSDWAAQSAISLYRGDPAKIVVVPYGANLDRVPTMTEVQDSIAQKSFHRINLLFVGADWERKRAGFAVEVVTELIRLRHEAVLHLVGCMPPKGFVVPPYVQVHGFISKESEQGRRQLDNLYKEAHFFVLPSKAEACAVVLAEAIAHGVPAVGSMVGGMGTIVRNGISGRLFPLSASACEFASYIAHTLADREGYAKLACSSRSLYETELNWGIAGRRFSDVLRVASSPKI
jgi:glycosyltransferase involved in cell wall biosynthesis